VKRRHPLISRFADSPRAHRDTDTHSGLPSIWHLLTPIVRCVDGDGTPFKPGVLADKGTKVRPVCDSLGADYLTPSQLGKDAVLTYQEVTSNEEISKARGHVERVIGGVKRFAMLKGIPHRLAYLVDEIVYFCAYSTLFF